MVSRDIQDNGFYEIYLEDVGDLRRDVFPEIYEEFESQKKINNELIEEIDIVKSDNAELARNQRYIGEILFNLILSLTKNGQGVKTEDGEVTIYPTPDFKLAWEESDSFAAMTKFKAGRQTLLELFGGEHKPENFPQLREVLKKNKAKTKTKKKG